jgi:hypothetical protein
MKKIVYLIILILAPYLNSYGQNITVYGGLNIAGSSSSDFVKFDISDWQNYGLLALDPNSNEGRVTVDLPSKKPSSISIGLMIGAKYSLNEKLSVLAEYQQSLSGLALTGTFIGLNYDLVKKEKFSLGLTPKIGFNTGSADLGEISLIPGYTPPVILPEGTFNVGDKLAMEFSGLAINLGLSPKIKFNDKLSIIGFLGYNLSFTKSDGLKCNGTLLPMTARGVVKSNGLGNQAGINPTITSSGLMIQLGVSMNL